MTWQILVGDAVDMLRTLPAGIAQTCVTSPPYWGLRDYGVDGQIGLEQTPEQYVARIVDVFREVRRVLRDDGTLWLNLGDSYAGASSGGYRVGIVPGSGGDQAGARNRNGLPRIDGMKPKDLVGIPWLVAFALRANGWYLRSDIIWSKPNPMPESVTDRPTKAHEYLFLLAKAERYFFDADAIREEQASVPIVRDRLSNFGKVGKADQAIGRVGKGSQAREGVIVEDGFRNRRTVWTVATQPFSGAHFATMPPKLVEPCVLAGSRHGDTVLDPFAGAGTTGLVALRHGRSFIGCELNPEYAEIARGRIHGDAPLLNGLAEVG